jgi:hypothetical protein
MLLVPVAVLSLSGCAGAADVPGDPGPVDSPTVGDTATWQLSAPDAVTPDSESIDVEVFRLACASGVTGEVLEPVVSYETEQVVIRIDVAPLQAGAGSCQSNNGVPVTVQLTEPLGPRALIDGGCLGTEATNTVTCESAMRLPAA